MAKVTLTGINSRYGSIDALNANFDAIEEALNNTLSRDGTSPNTMGTDVDMNSYRILNLPTPTNNTEPATKQYVDSLPNSAGSSAASAASSALSAEISAASALASASLIEGWEYKGNWSTSTAYVTNNIVYVNSGSYEGWTFIALEDHTSDASSFDTDYSASKWNIVSKRGIAGEGSGDMLSANNLSDVADASVARTNLGLIIGTNVQAYDADTAKIDVAQTFTAGQRGSITALTDGATITPNFADSNNFSVTLGGNRTMANPSNLVAGQSGSIFITQDGTGSRTLAWGSYWDFAGGTAPTLTTTAAAVDRVDYVVRSSTSIHAVFTGDYS